MGIGKLQKGLNWKNNMPPDHFKICRASSGNQTPNLRSSDAYSIS